MRSGTVMKVHDVEHLFTPGLGRRGWIDTEKRECTYASMVLIGRGLPNALGHGPIGGRVGKPDRHPCEKGECPFAERGVDHDADHVGLFGQISSGMFTQL